MLCLWEGLRPVILYPFFPLLNICSEREQVNGNKINDDCSFGMFCGALEKTEHTIKCVYGENSRAGRV